MLATKKDVDLLPICLCSNNPLIIPMPLLTFPAQQVSAQAILILCEVVWLFLTHKQDDLVSSMWREHTASERLIATIVPSISELLSRPL